MNAFIDRHPRFGFSFAVHLGAWAGALLLAAPSPAAEKTPKMIDTDVCVYAATPSGILAAVAVRRAGRQVVIVEPGRWVGGILGAGLKPMQDCPNYEATGGLTRQLLKTLGRPVLEENGRPVPMGIVNRRLNPGDIREDFLKLLEEHGIPVLYEHRVAECAGSGTAISTAVFDLAPFDELGCPVAEPKERGHLRVSAKVFIDASYEGDLMAVAGVAYRVGREAAAEFQEEFAGVQPPMEEAPIDPFAESGNPGSGLLKWVEHDHGKPLGAADPYTQAYNYRYYTTDDPDRRAPLTPPPGYDPRDFELVGRYVEHLVKTLPVEGGLFERLARIFPGWRNSGDWNYHRDSLFSMAPVGISQIYADGDYAAKARIWKEHQDYLRGLHRFMSTDPRVPEAFREQTAKLGLDLRHHPDTGGWPHQLYIRVARRLKGQHTITAHDVYNKTQVVDSVGLAQYGIDTYPSRRIWFERDGRIWVGLEGKMFIGGAKGPTNVPYPISYGAITPQTAECTNLLVPVCFSATHLGYASARMEPVFMICGESAGIAACRALEESAAVQEIDPVAFRQALEKAGQKLTWDPARDKPSEPAPSSGSKFTFETLLRDCDANGDNLVSQFEWSAGKSSFAWLFPAIDKDGNGQIDPAEYAGFQEYKAKHPDWQQRLSAGKMDH